MHAQAEHVVLEATQGGLGNLGTSRPLKSCSMPDPFLSKASSLMSSQAEQGTAPPSTKQANRTSTSSGDYGDLLAGAQSLMQGSNARDSTHKVPSSTDKRRSQILKLWWNGGSYGRRQALATSGKPSGGGADGASINKEELGAQKDARRSGSYDDVLASAQVLMKAGKMSGEADKGEAAGAAANLIGAASQYGDFEKRGYGEYANKAQAYLHDYQASHSKPVGSNVGGSGQKMPAAREDFEEDYKQASSKVPVNQPGREAEEERE
ncbi:hypothetical protein L7F22_050946 [Adiantum nelumboides]|nr:hypothetical protein [Adiantum nelumboides]